MALRLSSRTKLIAAVAAVVLLGAGFATYQITQGQDPEFRRGGAFGSGAPTTATSAATTGETAPPNPADTSPPESTTTTGAAAPGTTGPASPAPTGSGTTATTGPPVPNTGTTRPATSNSSAPSPGPAPAPAPSPSPAPSPEPAGPKLPATGTYTYIVDGTEQVTFVGTRRLPDRMTTSVHRAPDLAADQLVFDLRYSNEHEEREIVGFRDDGIYFDYEAGSVTFGPRTETSEADYEPPMLQVPKPYTPGTSRSGTSQAKAANGSVARTEQWKVTVLGQETLTIAGASVATWKVEVDRSFSGAESGTRTRTYWFDPSRAIWVKFTEVFHGERRTGGFTFTYDSNLTATLESFAAG